jgi:hypothetical protein
MSRYTLDITTATYVQITFSHEKVSKSMKVVNGMYVCI